MNTYEDAVLDFDLNLFNQATANTEPEAQAKKEKLRKAVIFLKKKVLFSHIAVTRYKNARKYANILESNQVFNKEGCKQHLIEIRNLIEDVARLDNECRAAETREKEKNDIIYDLQNKLEALQSHEKQLMLLLQEKSNLEPLQVEKNKDKATFRDRTRKGLLEKENEALKRQIERLKKENETLHKENNKSLQLEHENEINCKENPKILSLEKEIQNLQKEIENTKNLKKVNECLFKDNAKIPNLEKENENLRKEVVKIANLEKENKILHEENAKIPNLQKEIETLRKDNAKIVDLEKVNGTLRQENAKIKTLEKEIKTLIEHLALVKKEKSELRLKCHQLCKYQSLPDGNGDWGNNSDTENDMFEDSLLSLTATEPIMDKKSQTAAKHIAPLEFDNDNSNEVVSIDTGRGSSLACSDNEKCINSPEYSENDSLLNEENKENGEVASITKSAIPFEDTVETVNNPVIVCIENEESSDMEILPTTETNSISCNLLHDIESSVSPIKEARVIATGPLTVSENILSQQVHDVQAKECLELNNITNLACESHIDVEVERICSKMQLNFNAVSPIPRTPTSLRALESMTRLGEDTNILKLLGRIEILGEELTKVRKDLNNEIEERLRKSNQQSPLQSDNVALVRQLDSDYHYNNNTNKIAPPENALTTPCLLIKDPIINKPSLKISNGKISEDSNIELLPNRLSTDTDILQNIEAKNRSLVISLPKLQYHNSKQLLAQDTSEKLTTDKDISKSPDVIRNTRKTKSRPTTKLGKLKKKLEPKYKIRRETPPVRSRIKPKQLVVTEKKQLDTVDTSLAAVKNNNAYENAVKVMAKIKSQQNEKLAKSPLKHVQVPLSPKPNLEKQNNTNDLHQVLSQNMITTRSKRKYAELDKSSGALSNQSLVNIPASITDILKDKEDIETSDEQSPRKRPRRSANAMPEIQSKRILRSSTAQLRLSTENNTELPINSAEGNRKSIESHNTSEIKIPDMHSPTIGESIQENGQKCQQMDQDHSNVISYDDLSLFLEDKESSGPVKEVKEQFTCHPKESILCSMIDKHGMEIVRPFAKKVPDIKVKFVCEKLEQEIAKIVEVPPHETKNAMNMLVADLRKLNYKHFVTGLMKYLTKADRKVELFGKVNSPPAPSMTKAEQVLLYVISHLKTHWPSVDIVDAVLSNIEYTIFKLNRTPEFDVIETTSHFYALLCRYFGAKSRLRLFILDAMYCIQFKSLPLIKQCLEVWMHIIPLAHMGIAKSPLVTCLVYLLHFYKCDDKYNRIQDIRNILNRKYFYKITDWTEKKILEMFKISIMELKDIPVERKMLRLALIILAKRQGPRWCQNNIIKNLLQPMIEKEMVPNNVKEFCVSMLGPLMRPYPVDMKVHCEIVVNQLTDILNNEPTPQMEEAVITSMMFINRHDQLRINQTLLSRRMKPMSPELEKLLRDYVRTKPLKMWKKTLSKITRF